MRVLPLIVLAGCWMQAERDRAQRVWEMQDHEVAALQAREALQQGDLDALHAAGRELAKQDPVPGLPDEGERLLQQVRAHGTSLAEAPDTARARAVLQEMTATCTRCHGELEVEPPPELHSPAL